MSLIDKELKSTWKGLQGAKPHLQDFLEEINVRNLRGIADLRVPFTYPVTVLAGANACGKSTVLFGCAAAYKIPDNYAPSTPQPNNTPALLFPRYAHDSKAATDKMQKVELEYAYVNQGQRMSMKWRRGKSWSKSFFGRKGAVQPERKMYLRTLANLTNPAEVRSMLDIKYSEPTIDTVPTELLLLARQLLTFNYHGVEKVKKGKGVGDLLVATLKDEKGSYSEFHMSSGERSILRLSMEISQLENALVLIDEVETGLHPYIQKLLMLNLQRIALRQQLQIIVTTHSPIVLECVPPEGRVFLARDEQTQDVRVEKPMRDILQKAMYGQSLDKLSIMCEDDTAEAVIHGVVDALSVKMNFGADRIAVGRDTGRDEFPSHIRALGKVKILSDFVFILDGDARDSTDKMQAAAGDKSLKLLFLPGQGCPEAWVWQAIKSDYAAYETLLAIPQLKAAMQEIEALMGKRTSSNSSELFKQYLLELASKFGKEGAHIAREVARHCAANKTSDMIDFVTELQDTIEQWRSES